MYLKILEALVWFVMFLQMENHSQNRFADLNHVLVRSLVHRISAVIVLFFAARRHRAAGTGGVGGVDVSLQEHLAFYS